MDLAAPNTHSNDLVFSCQWIENYSHILIGFNFAVVSVFLQNFITLIQFEELNYLFSCNRFQMGWKKGKIHCNGLTQCNMNRSIVLCPVSVLLRNHSLLTTARVSWQFINLADEIIESEKFTNWKIPIEIIDIVFEFQCWAYKKMGNLAESFTFSRILRKKKLFFLAYSVHGINDSKNDNKIIEKKLLQKLD